ncbi:hypothetical protein RFI_36593 [Reticulomyxa filosa]|uniref:Uncharacterized protein n=1 Tax=Reticulomyxa filosa TaxID=46433 RepID=X6LI83_RETFI|nr:hypothetical protein RFI_36593 [Reticulomyxa filosa]|eukprot:ETO00847.1 hypothetical protein RFI_36593 [Reticulomyxa filosa]
MTKDTQNRLFGIGAFGSTAKVCFCFFIEKKKVVLICGCVYRKQDQEHFVKDWEKMLKGKKVGNWGKFCWKNERKKEMIK